MTVKNLDLLMSEIDRQMSIASNASQKTPFGSNQSVQELVIEDRGYYLAFKDWCRILDRHDKTKWEDIVIPPNFQRCLWKLLALSNSSSPILNREYQQIRCRGIQDIRRRSGLNDRHTEEIWQATSLRSWATSRGSSIVIIQGTSHTIDCLERFSYEISRQLGEKYPTIGMLSEPSSREFFSRKDETELLRQLAIQALQQISSFKAGFLIDIFRFFKECATSHNWFQILSLIFRLIPKVYVIVDLSILGSRINHAKSWPRDFQNLISQLSSSCASKLSVMLLSSRPLPRGDPKELVVSVTSQSQQLPQSRKRSHENSQTNSIRCLSTLMSMGERGNDQAECSLIPALRAERVTRYRMQETSSRFSSSPSADTLEFSYFSRPGNNHAPKNPFDGASSDASSSIPHRNDIGIAIVCALTREADAVLSVFDQHWDIQAFRSQEGDKNAYSVGRIGYHNVVLVHMPGMGRTPAATVAANCRTSFPYIGLALVVGICGAVPSYTHTTEILLGDVIISDRLVVYDFGRQFPDTFLRKETTLDSARKPPEAIGSFLAKIKGQMCRSILHERTLFHLEAMQQKRPTYPGVEEDRLFEPSYRHKHQKPSECAECASSKNPNDLVCDKARTSLCDALGCDLSKLVIRQRHSQIINGLETHDPEIHFGSYASGDKVMKSGEHRDQIAEREKVIAFEMEGAGVWEIFPCLIIKGVCDYADSHKNKNWQDYAAATAAACLKALLECWPARAPMLNT